MIEALPVTFSYQEFKKSGVVCVVSQYERNDTGVELCGDDTKAARGTVHEIEPVLQNLSIKNPGKRLRSQYSISSQKSFYVREKTRAVLHPRHATIRVYRRNIPEVPSWQERPPLYALRCYLDVGGERTS